jgi:hypothetical protein
MQVPVAGLQAFTQSTSVLQVGLAAHASSNGQQFSSIQAWHSGPYTRLE